METKFTHRIGICFCFVSSVVCSEGAGSGGDRLGGDGHWGRAGDPAKRVEGSLGELGGALRVAVTGKREQLLHQRPMRPPGVFPGKLPPEDNLLGTK